MLTLIFSCETEFEMNKVQKVQKNIKVSSDQYLQREKLSNSEKFKDVFKKTKKIKNLVNQKKEKNNPREEIKKKLRQIQQKMNSSTLKQGTRGIEISDVEQKRLFEEGKRLKIVLEQWNKHKKNKHKSKRKF